MRVATVCLIALTASCASRSVTTTGASATSAATTATATPQAARSRNDVISATEVEQASGITNAYDLVQRLRPNFLRVQERTSMRANPSSPLVRLNGQILGDATTLRSIEISVIQEIRYFSIVEAESRFGGDRGQPVIAVTTKKIGR